jgi:hypothetical protein
MSSGTLPNKNDAHLAGVLYLLMAIVGAFSIVYVPSHIIVTGNGEATAKNILEHETLFRGGIVGQFISIVLFTYLVLILYRLLRPVNDYLAKLMVAFVLVQVPIGFMNEAFSVTCLMILKGENMKAADLTQRQDYALLFLNVHKYGMIILEIFWGLWLFPFGQLVYKSGFIPRIFGVLLFIGGIGYLIDSLSFLLFPTFKSVVLDYVGISYAIGELSILFWLLIWGVRVRKSTLV